MTEGELISLQDLPAEILQAAGSATGEKLRLSDGGINLDREMEAFEKRWVQEALEEAKQVKSEAAHMLGVDRNRMNYLCRKYKL
jgi:DNA-binding NtrC family response regulator